MKLEAAFKGILRSENLKISWNVHDLVAFNRFYSPLIVFQILPSQANTKL